MGLMDQPCNLKRTQLLEEIREGEIPHEINRMIQGQVKSLMQNIISMMYKFKNGTINIIKGNWILIDQYFVISLDKQKQNIKKNGYDLEDFLVVIGPIL